MAKHRFSSAAGCALLVILSILILHGKAYAQEATPPAPTPDPAVTALQSTVTAQQAQIDALTREVSALRQEQDLDSRDSAVSLAEVQQALSTRLSDDVDSIQDELKSWRFWFVIGIGVLGILGLKSYISLDGMIQRRINRILDKEIYSMDPTHFRIYLPSELKTEAQRLKMSGLHNVKPYDHITRANMKGITIVLVTSEKHEADFLSCLKAYPFDPRKAAFILYTANVRYTISEGAQKAYANLAIANTPTTLVNAILAVGRGLRPDEFVEAQP